MYFTYILQSIKTGRYYFGHSHNLHERLKRHNAGRVCSTKGFRPWKIHYYETYTTKSEAYKRELYSKSLNGRFWLKEKGII